MPKPSRRISIIAATLLAAALVAGAMAATRSWTQSRAEARLETRGHAALTLHREIIRGWLGRFRTLTSIYARNPEIIALLRAPEDGVMVELANQRLELLNAATGAADTYVLDARGVTIASSNWAEPHSFVGNDYSFRPYFAHAMQGRLGRYFALGTSSGRRGYYFSFPVRDRNRIVGVVVVKAPVDPIEQELRSSIDPVFVVDKQGVVILASHPDWRLTTLGPLSSDAVAEIRANRQFDLNSLAPAPIEGFSASAPKTGGDSPRIVRARPDRTGAAIQEMRHFSEPMGAEGWTLHLLAPIDGVRAQVTIATLLTGASGLALALIVFGAWARRQRLLDQLQARAEAQRALERAVAERTADLSQTNARLAMEVAERTQAEQDLRRAQSELVQAGKLAALGQMSTSLSHEFNQPLGAIRAYAENAAAFLERGRQDRAEENLAHIGKLTERMARLSKHLTSFARKPNDAVTPVRLRQAIDEALELLNARLEKADAVVAVDCDPNLQVMGGLTRLQHVFINLIGNALDASADADAPRIALTAAARGDAVEVRVEDEGGGLSPEALEHLFDPFFTTKETGKGLGLGLSITYNILSDFGGGVRAENRSERGARFIVTLRPGDTLQDANAQDQDAGAQDQNAGAPDQEAGASLAAAE